MYLYFEIANKKKHLIDFHGTHGVRVYCTRLKYIFRVFLLHVVLTQNS